MANGVREQRHQRGWSLERLGRETGLSSETIRSIEDGRTRPRIDTAHRLAAAFEMTVDDLFPSDDAAA